MFWLVLMPLVRVSVGCPESKLPRAIVSACRAPHEVLKRSRVFWELSFGMGERMIFLLLGDFGLYSSAICDLGVGEKFRIAFESDSGP